MGISNSRLQINDFMDGSVVISCHYYGNDVKFGFGNVTATVQDKIIDVLKGFNNTGVFTANNKLFGDPQPGVFKTLFINYRVNNSQGPTLRYPENSTVRIQEIIDNINVLKSSFRRTPTYPVNVPPPNAVLPACIYGDIQYDYNVDGNQLQCKNGDDHSIGNYKKKTYQTATNSPCIGDKRKEGVVIEYQQNCPCNYGEYKTLPGTNSTRFTKIPNLNREPNTITGRIRTNGGDNCVPYTAPFYSISNNKIQELNINLDDQFLFSKLKNNMFSKVTNPITIDNFTVEPFTDGLNNTLYSNADILNIFNDTYYSYIYKCLGDEKDQKNMLQILREINNNSNITYDEVMQKAKSIHSSKIVLNDSVNKMDCATLKELLVKFNDYNIKNNSYTSHINNLTKYDVYDSKHKKIIDDYKTLNIERNDLDQKVRDLYNIPGYNSSNSKLEFDSTIYTGIIITVVASSLVYYAFTKL